MLNVLWSYIYSQREICNHDGHFECNNLVENYFNPFNIACNMCYLMSHTFTEPEMRVLLYFIFLECTAIGIIPFLTKKTSNLGFYYKVQTKKYHKHIFFLLLENTAMNTRRPISCTWTQLESLTLEWNQKQHHLPICFGETEYLLSVKFRENQTS